MRSFSRALMPTAASGQEVAPANLSARQAKEAGLLTSGTYGPRSTISSKSTTLQRFLENKLRRKTDLLGSTLYRLTWSRRTTPLGRVIFALRASAHRTSGNDCIGPLSGWNTPSTRDYKGGYHGGRIRNGKVSTDTLDVTAQLVSWPNGTRESEDTVVRLTDSGERLTGLPEETASGGPLNPEHSRWLMGLPAVWCVCAPTETPLSRRKQSSSANLSASLSRLSTAVSRLLRG